MYLSNCSPVLLSYLLDCGVLQYGRSVFPFAGFPRGEYASSTIPGEKYGKKEEKKQRRKEEGGNKGALM